MSDDFTAESVAAKLALLLPGNKTLETLHMDTNRDSFVRQESVRLAVVSAPGGWLQDDAMIFRAQAIYDFISNKRDGALLAAAREFAKAAKS